MKTCKVLFQAGVCVIVMFALWTMPWTSCFAAEGTKECYPGIWIIYPSICGICCNNVNGMCLDLR